MPRSSSSRPTRALAIVVAALAVGLTGVLGGAPAAGEEIVDPSSHTTLTVAPGERTTIGTALILTAEVDDADGDPVIGEQVRFSVDGATIATVALDAEGRATATVTPAQGAHWLQATYRGTHELMGSSAERRHSVLPATCPDAAQPDAGAVVRHAYLVALHRCPDPAGYAYWVDRLEAGAAPGAVSAALARSPEAIEVVVDEAYRRILGRPADPAGRAVWAAKLRAGWATSQLWAALAASPELAHGTSGAGELVERAFVRIVGRPSDPAGHAYWQGRLASAPPSSTWRALAVTAEVVDGVVLDAFAAVLGRPPTAAEAAAARATIGTRRGDWRPLRAELLARPEASTYAQRYPDPEPDL